MTNTFRYHKQEIFIVACSSRSDFGLDNIIWKIYFFKRKSFAKLHPPPSLAGGNWCPWSTVTSIGGKAPHPSDYCGANAPPVTTVVIIRGRQWGKGEAQLGQNCERQQSQGSDITNNFSFESCKVTPLPGNCENAT